MKGWLKRFSPSNAVALICANFLLVRNTHFCPSTITSSLGYVPKTSILKYFVITFSDIDYH